MARTRKNQMKVCSVTGLETNVNNFYKNQNHVKAVDNLRRTTNATKAVSYTHLTLPTKA